MVGGLSLARVLVWADVSQTRRQTARRCANPCGRRRLRSRRVPSLAFKALRLQQPDYPLWRDFPYEYELDRLAIDVINSSPLLREWVDDACATPEDLELIARADEQAWEDQRLGVLLY